MHIMSATDSITITRASTARDIADIARLFTSYVEALGIDLTYQDFSGELAALPGNYSPPNGTLLLARNGNKTAVGCVALRPLPAPGCCEMKRLFVTPEARGSKLGRRLAEAVINEAVRMGYQEMRLDTLPMLSEALALYESMGFTGIAPYYDTPIADTIFLSKSLRS